MLFGVITLNNSKIDKRVVLFFDPRPQTANYDPPQVVQLA